MKHYVIKLFLTLALFSFLLVVTFVVVDGLLYSQKTQKAALKNGVKKLSEREYTVKNFLSSSENTLFALRDSQTFQSYLKNRANKKDVENFFLTFAKSQIEFMQLRYIDKNGLEKIRIDRNRKNNTPFIVDALQDKSDRYYFTESKHKELEKIWYSKIDLNIEHGKIEEPFKPTLRAILPIGKNNKFEGILIINYFMDNFFKALTYTPLYDIILYDDKGFTLSHFNQHTDDHTKCWGNSLKHQYNISSEFPNQYRDILNNDNKVYKTKSFVSKRFDIPIYGGLHMMLQLKESYLQTQKSKQKEEFLVVSSLTILISLILSIVIVRQFSKIWYRLEYKTKELEELNKTLEKKVEEGIESLRQKDKMMFQQAKMASMGEMLGNIAHQWRQPLNALSAVNYKVKMRYKSGKLDDEAIEEFQERSKNLLGKMNDTIDDFRNFFRPDKERQEFDINESLQNVVKILQGSFQSNDIELEIECEKDIVIDGYKNELEQVFLVILNNSKDAIKDSKKENGKILVNIEEIETEIVIKIKDNGGGVSEEIIERVFEPYFTTKHQDVGTGIGLYMAKMIIEESMNGKITIANLDDGLETIIILKKEHESDIK